MYETEEALLVTHETEIGPSTLGFTVGKSRDLLLLNFANDWRKITTNPAFHALILVPNYIPEGTYGWRKALESSGFPKKAPPTYLQLSKDGQMKLLSLEEEPKKVDCTVMILTPQKAKRLLGILFENEGKYSDQLTRYRRERTDCPFYPEHPALFWVNSLLVANPLPTNLKIDLLMTIGDYLKDRNSQSFQSGLEAIVDRFISEKSKAKDVWNRVKDYLTGLDDQLPEDKIEGLEKVRRGFQTLMSKFMKKETIYLKDRLVPIEEEEFKEMSRQLELDPEPVSPIIDNRQIVPKSNLSPDLGALRNEGYSLRIYSYPFYRSRDDTICTVKYGDRREEERLRLYFGVLEKDEKTRRFFCISSRPPVSHYLPTLLDF